MQSLIDNQWLQVIRKGLSLELPLDQEKHSAHEAVTLEVRALPKAGFSSSMETVLRWKWVLAPAPDFLFFLQSIKPMPLQGDGTHLHDILDGAIHRANADGCSR